MNKKKNNHYVPQFHLRQWSKNQKTIMVYNLSKDLYIKNASIKNQASRNYLYGHDNNFEDAMGKIETIAGQLYSKIILNKNLYCLNDEELDFLYFFVNLCNERSFSRAEEQQLIATEVTKLWLKMNKDHNDPRTKDISYKTIENIKINYNNPNLVSVQTILKYYGLTYDLDCVLLYNKSQYELLTSDYPTIVYNLFSNIRNIYSGWGMSSGGIIYILPISPKFAIMLYDSCMYDCKVKNTIVEIKNEKDINEINKLTMLNSETCIFGSDSIPQNYLKNLKKGLTLKKNNPINKLISNTDEIFIHVHRKRLNYTTHFSFLKLKNGLMNLPIPNNAAGIIRPQSEDMNKKLQAFWKIKEKELDKLK